MVSVDTETNFTDMASERYCLGVSLTTNWNTYYIPVNHQHGWLGRPKNVEIPSDLFKGLSVPIIAHNMKFDFQVLRKLGVPLPTSNLWCTMMMGHFIDENKIGKGKDPHSLETMAPKYLGVESQKEVAKAKVLRPIWEISPPYLMAEYAEQDARLLPDLYKKLMSMMEQPWIEQWNNFDREFMLLLADIETLGLPLDYELCARYEDESEQRLFQIERELGFDPAKDSQLHPKLFGDRPGDLGLPVPSRTPKSGKPQVKLEWLEANSGHRMCALLYEYRKLAKQKSSYFSAFLERTTRDYPRLHPTFHQHGTVTQRLTCKNPNLQQIPREDLEHSSVKKLFKGEEGRQLWEIDFRTLEYRHMACQSKCQRLIKLFSEEGDIHQDTADYVGVDRHTAKNKLVYAAAYGAGEATLAKGIGGDMRRGREIVRMFKGLYPEIFDAFDRAEAVARANGNTIRMWNGRVRHFQWPGECRSAFNHITQGGSFEIVKRSMLKLREAGFKMHNQVHDSVWLGDISSESEVIEAQKLMEDWTVEAFGLRFSTDRKRLK